LFGKSDKLADFLVHFFPRISIIKKDGLRLERVQPGSLPSTTAITQLAIPTRRRRSRDVSHESVTAAGPFTNRVEETVELAGQGSGASLRRLDSLDHLLPSFTLLLQAERYAQVAGRPNWDFAVELEQLRQAGMTNSDLRLLASLGLVEHATERTPPEKDARSFQPEGQLVLSSRTCAVLTEEGSCTIAEVVAQLGGGKGKSSTGQGGEATNGGSIPRWDASRRVLSVRGGVVKHFRQPAANQETILAAFQEEGWPWRIDDPLPREHGQDPKRRLSTTITSLNRNQQRRVLAFSGDGHGQGVAWSMLPKKRMR
jgi:hypothetical protein